MNYGAKTFLKERREKRLIRRGGEPQPLSAIYMNPVIIIDVATYKGLVRLVDDE